MGVLRSPARVTVHGTLSSGPAVGEPSLDELREVVLDKKWRRPLTLEASDRPCSRFVRGGG